MIDVMLLVVLGVVTWSVANDGPWGAAITLVSVLLSGFVAMNFFEPLAALLSENVLGDYAWQTRWDIVAFLGLFSAGVFGMRLLAEQLLPTYAEVSPLVYELARWGFGLVTGYTVMAILLTSLHVAPLPREFLGFTPERNNFFQISAPDRQWLALTQYVSETSLKRVLSDGRVPVFDGPEFPRIPTDLNTAQRWSSFPIRYAARRQQFASGQSGAASATPAAPPPTSGGGAAF